VPKLKGDTKKRKDEETLAVMLYTWSADGDATNRYPFIASS